MAVSVISIELTKVNIYFTRCGSLAVRLARYLHTRVLLACDVVNRKYC